MDRGRCSGDLRCCVKREMNNADSSALQKNSSSEKLAVNAGCCEELIEGGDRLLQQRRGDRAVRDRQIAMRGGFAIAQRGLRGSSNVQPNAVAIGPGIGGENADIGRDGYMSAFERLDQDAALHRELRGVVRVLVMTAAAASEIFAAGNDAVRRGFEHRIEFGGEIAAVLGLDGRLRPTRRGVIAGQRQPCPRGLAGHPPGCGPATRRRRSAFRYAASRHSPCCI